MHFLNLQTYLYLHETLHTHHSPDKYVKIKINTDDDLPLEKILSMYKVVILIKSVFNKDYNHYHYLLF